MKTFEQYLEEVIAIDNFFLDNGKFYIKYIHRCGQTVTEEVLEDVANELAVHFSY